MTDAMTTEVVVYRTRTCPFCIGAVDLLRARGIPFREISLDDDPDRRRTTDRILPGHTTVPLIVIDGRPIGGFRELSAMDAAGQLTRLSRG